jgi:hypothetical protein
MQIDLGKLIQEYRTAEQNVGAEMIKAYGLSGTGFDNYSLMDIFGSPGHSAIGTSAIRDIEQVRGWNFTAILAKALQFGLGSMAVYCPQWIAEAICEHNGIEYKASKRITGSEQYGVPEDWVTAPTQHRIAALLRSPNPWKDEATFLFEIAEQTNIHGVAHILVLPNANGMPQELWVIPKAAIQAVAPSSQFPEGSYRIGHLSKLSINTQSEEEPLSLQQALARISNREYSAKFVIPIGLPSPMFSDDFLNVSSAIADTVDTDKVLHQTRRNMLEKMMTTGPRLEPMPGVTISNSEWSKLLEEFEAQNLGPDKQGNAWRSPPGIKVSNDSHTGREMEFVNSVDQSRDHTLGQHLLSSAMLGLGSGGSYAQVVGLIKGNARLILQPLMRIYSGQLTIGLRRFMQSPQNQFMVLLQAANIDDPEQRRSEWDLLMKSKAVKVREVREAFNMMPLGTEEDDKLVGATPDPYAGYGYEEETGTDAETDTAQMDSGEPETPGIGAPEAAPETLQSVTTSPAMETPSLGKMSRREFMRHSKNISDIVEKYRDGKFGEKTARLMLQTLGLTTDMAQEFIDSVKDLGAEESMSSNDNQTTASAVFARMAEFKASGGAFMAKSLIDEQAQASATYPGNMLRDPSDQQRKEGTYRKARLRLCGLIIEIENPAFSVRSGLRPDGTRWAVEMQDHYGYIVGAVGFDKDQLDVFVKRGTEPDFNGMIYVINQANEDGTFDEHKCFIGCDSKIEAIKHYLQNYDDEWSDRIMSVAALTIEQFKKWLIDGQNGPLAGALHPEGAMQYVSLSSDAMFERAVSSKSAQFSAMFAKKNETEKDGDGDGVIFDGTPQERPAPNRLEELKRRKKPQQDDDTRRVMFEAAPDPNDLMLTSRWRNLTDEDRLRISRTLVDAIMPDVAQRIGADISVSEQLGGYLDDTNPSFAAQFQGAVQPEKFIRTMKAAGFALSQDSMMGISTTPIAGGESVGFVTVQMDNGQDVHDLYMKIRAIDDSVQGHTTIGNEMMIVDFTGRGREIAQTIQDNFGVSATHANGYAVFISKDQYGYEQSEQTQAAAGGTSQRGSAELAEKRWGNSLRGKASAIINRELKAVEARTNRLLKAVTPAGGFFRTFTVDPVEPTFDDDGSDDYDDDDSDDDALDDPREKNRLIAEILVGCYGTEAESILDDVDDFEALSGAFAKAFAGHATFKDATSRRRRSPRRPRPEEIDGDGDGVIHDGTPEERPAPPRRPQWRGGNRPKNSPERIAQINADVERALNGDRSAKSAKELAESLRELTVKQLRDIKLKYNLKASGRTKQELVDKLALRMDSGRRADRSAATVTDRANAAARSAITAIGKSPNAARDRDVDALRRRRDALVQAADKNQAVSRDMQTVGQQQAAERHARMSNTLREAAGQLTEAKNQIAEGNRLDEEARSIAEQFREEARQQQIQDRARENQARMDAANSSVRFRGVNDVGNNQRDDVTESHYLTLAKPEITVGDIEAMYDRTSPEQHQALTDFIRNKEPQLGSIAQHVQDESRATREFQRITAIENQILETMRQNAAVNYTMRDLATLTQTEPGSANAPLNSPLNRALSNLAIEGRIIARDRQFGGPIFSLRPPSTPAATTAAIPASEATSTGNATEQRLAALKQNLPGKFVVAQNEDGQTVLVSPNERTRVLPDDPAKQVRVIESQLRNRGINPDDVVAGRVRGRKPAAVTQTQTQTPAPVATSPPAAQPPQQRGPLTSEQRTALKKIGADFLDDIEPDADGNLIQAIPSRARVVINEAGARVPQSWQEIPVDDQSRIRESYSQDVRRTLKTSSAWRVEIRDRAKTAINSELDAMTSEQVATAILPRMRNRVGLENATVEDVKAMLDTGEELAAQTKERWRLDTVNMGLVEKLDGRRSWMRGQYAAAVNERINNVSPEQLYRHAQSKNLMSAQNAPRTAQLLNQFGMTTQDLASVIGARDDWQVTVTPSDYNGGSLSISVNNSTARMSRSIHMEDGKMRLYNSSFFMDDNAPKGLGLQVFSQSIANAKRLGFAEVKTMPCRSSTMVGYAVWPQFGYDADISSIGSGEVRRRTQAQFPNARTIRDIYDTPGGQEWWWANGDSLNTAKFDLTSGSRNMTALQNYMKKKKSQRDRVRSSAPTATA